MDVKKQEKVLNTENAKLKYAVKTFNKIADRGLERFSREQFDVAADIANPDAIVLRSQDLHGMAFNAQLKAVGRAGAGTNNIPVKDCTEKGIVVFNTPGANANAVKELVIAGMLLASRDIVGGIHYAKSLAGQDGIKEKVEKAKAKFGGRELKGKTLGVVGLGAIGTMLANNAVALGLEVMGYDPFISVGRAWDLSNEVKPAPSLERMLRSADYISLHVPLTDHTHQFLSKEKLPLLKKDAVVLNFSRSEIVNESAIRASLDQNPDQRYVTDFPSAELVAHPQVISIPHLGASTVEAEENCAVMIADQISDFLMNGNIVNSVNFPNCSLERNGKGRLTVANQNVPNMVGQITTILAAHKYNIVEMLNKSRQDVAYSILDLDQAVSEAICQEIRAIAGVIAVRALSE